MSCLVEPNNSSLLKNTVHVWCVKINFITNWNSNNNALSPSKHLLMTCKTRYMKILTFSLVQWLDYTAWSKNTAKERHIGRFLVGRDILLPAFVGIAFLSCFLLCRRLPQKARQGEQITRGNTCIKCVQVCFLTDVFWYAFAQKSWMHFACARLSKKSFVLFIQYPPDEGLFLLDCRQI